MMNNTPRYKANETVSENYSRVDKKIREADRNFRANIAKLEDLGRGLVSWNIIGYLRTFVELLMIKVTADSKDPDPDDQTVNKEARNKCQKDARLRLFYEFHALLQKSVSHYIHSQEEAERLMLKYYSNLVEIRQWMKEKYSFAILDYLDEYPLNLDKEQQEFQKAVAQLIETFEGHYFEASDSEVCYIKQVKPFVVNGKIYYELTYFKARDKVSKFDHEIAFTKCKIFDNYATRLFYTERYMDFHGNTTRLRIVGNYTVEIRPCEINNFAQVFNLATDVQKNNPEYKRLMEVIKNNRLSLTELVSSDGAFYENIRAMVTDGVSQPVIFGILDRSRNFIIKRLPGYKVLAYLLYRLNNVTIKRQIFKSGTCDLLTGLKLQYGCKPFDEMPFCTSLIKHNPAFIDLINALETDNREHELFARYLKDRIENTGEIFIPEKEILNNTQFTDIRLLMQRYNEKLYYQHENRKIDIFKDKYYYIKEYVDHCSYILSRLQALSATGIELFRQEADQWLAQNQDIIDDPKKKIIIGKMFDGSQVLLICGAAGTGKTTLLKYIADIYKTQQIVFLANTHAAVNNLSQKIKTENKETENYDFITISKFNNSYAQTEADLLIIDECSTISNRDMYDLLNKHKFRGLILVGDVCQIEAINFGNWFSFAKKALSTNSVFELESPYRTSKDILVKVWNEVRTNERATLEIMLKGNILESLSSNIFNREGNDEIVLCHNYDGFYGINNFNKIMQDRNHSRSVVWDKKIFKINDPILFNECMRFNPIIHNNVKGRIADFEVNGDTITFIIEVYDNIADNDSRIKNFRIIDHAAQNSTLIAFDVNRLDSYDQDDEDESSIVPFQVAYAVSIHKAQGLEYESVKLVISDESLKYITHDIFYTAITRSKNRLKIYCSPELGTRVLKGLKPKDINKDFYLLQDFMHPKRGG